MKKAIVINEKNMNRIQQELDLVQKRSKVRTIDASNIVSACNRIEKVLGGTKKALVGTVATIDLNAQDFPNAYKYVPESTIIKIERTSSGWKLIDVYRDVCRRWKDEYSIGLTEQTKQEILDRYSKLM